jgi:hypothetical protein
MVTWPRAQMLLLVSAQGMGVRAIAVTSEDPYGGRSPECALAQRRPRRVTVIDS